MKKLSPQMQEAADEVCELVINECPANLTLLAGNALLAYDNGFLRSVIEEFVHRQYMQQIGMSDSFSPLEKLGIGLLQVHMKMHGVPRVLEGDNGN